MKDIECEIQLSSEFNSDDDVLQKDVSNKRIVREGIEETVRRFVADYVKPELGTAYRVPPQVPISYGKLPKGDIAMVRIYLPEQNDSLRHKLTMMLIETLKRDFPGLGKRFSVLVDHHREAA
jgi:hypothetical protein